MKITRIPVYKYDLLFNIVTTFLVCIYGDPVNIVSYIIKTVNSWLVVLQLESKNNRSWRLPRLFRLNTLFADVNFTHVYVNVVPEKKKKLVTEVGSKVLKDETIRYSIRHLSVQVWFTNKERVTISYNKTLWS